MSKHVSQDRLALYAGGDLSIREANAVADHLSGCAECRTALAEFEEMRNLVTSSCREPELLDLYEVRERVNSRLAAAEGRKHWMWGLAGAAAMASVLVSLFIIRQQPQKSDPVQLAAQPPSPLMLPPPRLTELPIMHRGAMPHLKPGVRSVALITRAEEPPLIRMTTTDPNVVILWQSNKEEENE